MDVQSNLEYLRMASSCRNESTKWSNRPVKNSRFNAFERLFTELETQKTQRCASKNCSIFVSKFDENISLSKEREKEREYYVGLLFFNLLNPLIGETRVKSPLFTCQSFELVKFFFLTFIHSSLFYRVTTF